MSDLTTQQIQSISNYRVNNPKYMLLNDEAILSIMQKEVREGGAERSGAEPTSAFGLKGRQGSRVMVQKEVREGGVERSGAEPTSAFGLKGRQGSRVMVQKEVREGGVERSGAERSGAENGVVYKGLETLATPGKTSPQGGGT